jgi:hypothetical protein
MNGLIKATLINIDEWRKKSSHNEEENTRREQIVVSIGGT